MNLPFLKNFPALTVTCLLIFCLVPWIGMSPFYTRGEAREALIAQSMVRTGEYILPRGYNDSVPSKPPVFHWVAALTSHLTGQVNEFSVRFPSVFFAILGVVFFLFSLRSSLTPNSQLLFTLLLLLSFEWTRASVSARVDMTHASALSCGLLSAYFALERDKICDWIFLIAFIAIATLAKGPVAILLAAIVIIAWVVITRGPAAAIKPLFKLGGALTVSLCIAFLWYAAAYYTSPQEFFAKFWYENVSRFTSTMEDAPHKHSAIYLVGMLILGTAPASILILSILFKERSKYFGQGLMRWQALPKLERFSLIAAASVILFYCIPSSKRGVYLLAAYPFLALFTALFVERVSSFNSKRLWQWLFTGAFVVTIAQAIIIPKFIASRSSERVLGEMISQSTQDSNPIYSYGFEFYGASFYSEKQFLRLEDAIKKDLDLFHKITSVIFFQKKFEELSKLMNKHGKSMQIINQISLKDEKVLIATVE